MASGRVTAYIASVLGADITSAASAAGRSARCFAGMRICGRHIAAQRSAFTGGLGFAGAWVA